MLFECINDVEYEISFCLHCSDAAQFTTVCHADPSQYIKSSIYEIFYCWLLDCGNRFDGLHIMSFKSRTSIFLFQEKAFVSVVTAFLRGVSG